VSGCEMSRGRGEKKLKKERGEKSKENKKKGVA
jgi:hypothetical protein